MRSSSALERLAAAVDADVRQRRRGQHAAHRIERLGPGRLAEDEVAVGRVALHRRRGRGR